MGQHDLRISFDSNIRTRRYDLRLEDGDYGDLLLEEGTWLMEIKTAQSIPVWLCHLLSENKIYPTSFSKYGTDYKKNQERQKAAVIYNYSLSAEAVTRDVLPENVFPPEVLPEMVSINAQRAI